MVPFAGLLAALEQIPDPRRRQGQRYSLAPLLLFAVLAVLAGATSYRRIRLFIGVHRERLNAVFGAGFRRAPAINTLRTLFHALDPAEIEAAFRDHAEQLGNATAARGGGSSRWTARRCGAASTTWTTGPRRRCSARSPARTRSSWPTRRSPRATRSRRPRR